MNKDLDLQKYFCVSIFLIFTGLLALQVHADGGHQVGEYAKFVIKAKYPNHHFEDLSSDLNYPSCVDRTDDFLKQDNIIIAESSPELYLSKSEKELFDFIDMIYDLNFKKEINIFLKKKRLHSPIEDYLNLNFPRNDIKFLPHIRGLMTDFSNKDFIISSGISSLGIKASELFNIPYVVHDQSNLMMIINHRPL